MGSSHRESGKNLAPSKWKLIFKVLGSVTYRFWYWTNLDFSPREKANTYFPGVYVKYQNIIISRQKGYAF